MSWPLFLGILFGVIVTDICCQRIKKNAKKPNFVDPDLLKKIEKPKVEEKDKIKE